MGYRYMFIDWLLASLHHLAVFSLAAILSAEIFLTAGPIDDRMVLRVARIDAWFGIFAALVARRRDFACVFRRQGPTNITPSTSSFGPRWRCSSGSGSLSVAPTMLYIGWRRRVRADPRRSARQRDEIAQLRQALYVEAGLVRLQFRFAPRRWRAATGCEGATNARTPSRHARPSRLYHILFKVISGYGI